jgi:hypothetical protein
MIRIVLALFVGVFLSLPSVADAQSSICARYPMPHPSAPSAEAIPMLEARLACLNGDLTSRPLSPVLPLLDSLTPRSRRSPSDDTYLGTYSANRYAPDSIANPYGQYGNRYAPDSVNNPYGSYGSPYSLTKPRLYGRDGTYLGTLSSNPYDPDSIANPYGRYGNPYSPDSVNNPYGRFGSPYSPDSATNPYALSPPLIFGDGSR